MKRLEHKHPQADSLDALVQRAAIVRHDLERPVDLLGERRIPHRHRRLDVIPLFSRLVL